MRITTGSTKPSQNPSTTKSSATSGSSDKKPSKPKPNNDKLSLARRLEVRLGKTMKKLVGLAKDYRRIDDESAWKAATELDGMLQANACAHFAARVPDDAKAKEKEKKQRGARGKVEAGATVSVKPHKRPSFDILEEKDLVGLTVVKLKGNKALCRTAAGVEAIFPVAALSVDAAAKPVQEQIATQP